MTHNQLIGLLALIIFGQLIAFILYLIFKIKLFVPFTVISILIYFIIQRLIHYYSGK